MSRCSCGEPHISERITHRYDGKPCYVTDSVPTPQTPIEILNKIRLDELRRGRPGNIRYTNEEALSAIYNLLAEMAVEVRDPNGFITKHFKAIPLDKLKELLDE